MRILGLVQNLTKEALGGTGVAPGGEQEVNRLPIFVHCPEEVAILASDPDASLIDPVALRGRLEMMSATPLGLRAVGLDGTARPELRSMARPRSRISSATGASASG